MMKINNLLKRKKTWLFLTLIIVGIVAGAVLFFSKLNAKTNTKEQLQIRIFEQKITDLPKEIFVGLTVDEDRNEKYQTLIQNNQNIKKYICWKTIDIPSNKNINRHKTDLIVVNIEYNPSQEFVYTPQSSLQQSVSVSLAYNITVYTEKRGDKLVVLDVENREPLYLKNVNVTLNISDSDKIRENTSLPYLYYTRIGIYKRVRNENWIYKILKEDKELIMPGAGKYYGNINDQTIYGEYKDNVKVAHSVQLAKGEKLINTFEEDTEGDRISIYSEVCCAKDPDRKESIGEMSYQIKFDILRKNGDVIHKGIVEEKWNLKSSRSY